MESMSIDTESVCLPGKSVCEDLIGNGSRSIWVLDGATGIGRTVTDGDSDAQWYVEQLDCFLEETADDTTQSLSDVARSAIEHVSELYTDFDNAAEPRAASAPTATGAILRLRDETIEYLILGNVSIFRCTTGDIERIVDNRNEPFEQATIEKMHSYILNQGSSLNEAREHATDLLRQSKGAVNTTDGHWGFGLVPEAADEALTGTIDQRTTERIYVCTDGFTDIRDVFSAFNDWRTVFDYARIAGLATVIDQLRDIQAADDNCRLYPRTKPRDDASAVQILL